AVQAANDTNTDDDRGALQNEIKQLLEEIDRIAQNTEFNTKKLLNGSLSTSGLVLHIGANASQSITLTIEDMQASELGVSGLSIETQASADAAIETIDNAIKLVSDERAKLGAVQNRLEHTINNLGAS